MYREPDFESLLGFLPEPTVILTVDLVVRHVNAAFLSVTGTSEVELLERQLIDDVFPDQPGAAAPGRSRLRDSFRLVTGGGRSDVAGVSRYDLAAAGQPDRAPRFWSPVNSPISDDNGVVRFIVHRVQDVTPARALLSTLVSGSSILMPPGRTADLDHNLPLLGANDGFTGDLDPKLAELIDTLLQLLDTRSLVEQAAGMLMAAGRMRAEVAVQLLRRRSVRGGLKLRDVAARHLAEEYVRAGVAPPTMPSPPVGQLEYVPMQGRTSPPRCDDTGSRRDRAADRRDDASDARDRAADLRDWARIIAGGTTTNHAQAETDRLVALVDRAAAAVDRQHAVLDRSLAADDRRRAEMDVLTGVHGRRSGLRELELLMARIATEDQSMVLAFVDVDFLKATNDFAGHAAGDQLLTAVADALTTRLRPGDLILRYGGDEFLCALPGVAIDGARRRFRQVSAHLAKAARNGSITIGLAEFRPDDSGLTLIGRADADLYQQRRARDVRPTAIT